MTIKTQHINTLIENLNGSDISEMNMETAKALQKLSATIAETLKQRGDIITNLLKNRRTGSIEKILEFADLSEKIDIIDLRDNIKILVPRGFDIGIAIYDNPRTRENTSSKYSTSFIGDGGANVDTYFFTLMCPCGSCGQGYAKAIEEILSKNNLRAIFVGREKMCDSLHRNKKVLRAFERTRIMLAKQWRDFFSVFDTDSVSIEFADVEAS